MNLPEESIWQDGIYQLETTDPVLGGDLPGGISNQQAKQLADRTVYLKSKVGVIEDIYVVGVGANTTFTATDIFNKLVCISPEGPAFGYTVTLNCQDLPDGAMIRLSVVASGNKWVKLNFVNDAGFIGFNGGGFQANAIWLYGGETLTVAYKASGCFVIDLRGNYDRTGEVVFKYKPPTNSIIAQGQLVNRADYPRLWNWAQTTGGGGSPVTDQVWLLNGLRYTGCFSLGNGSTTFRLPDLRGMFIRGLDLSRGIDISRVENSNGGYEADDNKQHGHTTAIAKFPVVGQAQNNPSVVPANTVLVGGYAQGVSSFGNDSKVSNNVGSAESRPKNVAYTPYILL